MSILKELNELAAKYKGQDYEKETTIEGAIDAVDKSLEGALVFLRSEIVNLQDLAYGEGSTPADPAEGSILGRIDVLEENSGILVVGVTRTEDENEEEIDVLDKTWQEIYDAPFAVLVDDADMNKAWVIVDSAYRDPGDGYVARFGNLDYVASSPDGYPQYPGGGGK